MTCLLEMQNGILRVTEWLFYKGPLVLFTFLWSMVLGFKRIWKVLAFYFPPGFFSQVRTDVVSLKKRNLGDVTIASTNSWITVVWGKTTFLYKRREEQGRVEVTTGTTMDKAPSALGEERGGWLGRQWSCSCQVQTATWWAVLKPSRALGHNRPTFLHPQELVSLKWQSVFKLCVITF